ncbi:uncharacterized protein LOC118308790 isoform X2 [Scophthalmus maximus]|uniref:uncharacterized protein LOC118308790 isoform X2 n=1 Tax=Scophthalmus maximus TaxID=52904 RepID=UPI001FA81FC4|nr:uncharacterized protein LOC118308790 isoform X2 [Scophthalmus maximus]
MSSSVSTTVDGVVVVTHVHPAPQGAGPQHGTTLQRFSRSQPLVLGYIIAGSLTVAAGKYLTRSLVNAALVLCVIAAVASATGTILYSLDATGVMWYCYNGYDGRNDCYRYKTRMHGVSGALAVFNLLELIVSITIAGYACSATCNCTQEPPSVVYVPAASVGARDAPSAQEAIGDAIDFCSQMLENSSAMLDNSSAMLDNSFVI